MRTCANSLELKLTVNRLILFTATLQFHFVLWSFLRTLTELSRPPQGCQSTLQWPDILYGLIIWGPESLRTL